MNDTFQVLHPDEKTKELLECIIRQNESVLAQNEILLKILLHPSVMVQEKNNE